MTNLEKERLRNERVISEANYLLETNGTIRSVAKFFGMSKSAIYKDLTDYLRDNNNSLYLKVQEILQYNKQVRALRGGIARGKLQRELKNDNQKDI